MAINGLPARAILAPVLLGTAAALVVSEGVAQGQGEFVVEKVAEKSIGTLPEGDLYWTAETFASFDEAKAAEGETSVAAEIDGKAWLLTLGPEDAVGHGGEVMATVGPIERFDAPEYLLRINTSDAPPGSMSSVHSHPGSEAMYVLSGEVTVRWPDRTDVLEAGDAGAGQSPHTTMQASSTGDEKLRGLIMFVVDPTQEFAKPETFD